MYIINCAVCSELALAIRSQQNYRYLNLNLFGTLFLCLCMFEYNIIKIFYLTMYVIVVYLYLLPFLLISGFWLLILWYDASLARLDLYPFKLFLEKKTLHAFVLNSNARCTSVPLQWKTSGFVTKVT